MTAGLIFPHQLFSDNPLFKEGIDRYYLIEDHLFFTRYNFHKAKLVLHRASMKYYQATLEEDNKNIQYIEHHEADLETVFKNLKSDKVDKVVVVYPSDYLLERRLKRFSDKNKLELIYLDSPNYLTSRADLEKRLDKKKSGYFMAKFYEKQRLALDLLIDNGDPLGGQWSFDEENRKKLPKDIDLPRTYSPNNDEFVEEAIHYVQQHFTDNLGEVDSFNYPISPDQASRNFDDFLENRMELFGDYEDAIAKKENVLFHSLLTPGLNIGLINPDLVLTKTMNRHEKYDYPINCLEGFIRQIIGWREFMHGIYLFEGVKERTTNHFGHKRKIPKGFYTGKTGVVPIDQTIRKVLKTGYCHHIERLMIFGNFMLLCEFDPDEVYRWFMELFIDAYDWVMVPNVYGMTQYADGGLITTKPYISSSNYILKMSDYKKGEWCNIWDGLYWRFIHIHNDEFKKNHRMSFMVSMLEKMDKSKLNSHLEIAEEYLAALDDNKSLGESSLFD